MFFGKNKKREIGWAIMPGSLKVLFVLLSVGILSVLPNVKEIGNGTIFFGQFITALFPIILVLLTTILTGVLLYGFLFRKTWSWYLGLVLIVYGFVNAVFALGSAQISSIKVVEFTAFGEVAGMVAVILAMLYQCVLFALLYVNKKYLV
jgi:hypothetical protein